MIKWLFNRMSTDKKKEFIVYGLFDILKSKETSIDQMTAIKLIEAITASKGNKVTAFIEFPVANASLELIVSGSGTTTFVITTEGNTTASLNGSGSTTFSFSLNHLAMYLNAYGYANANIDVLTTGSGTLKAIAICSGSTVDTTGLTPASIWAYQPNVALKADVYAARFL